MQKNGSAADVKATQSGDHRMVQLVMPLPRNVVKNAKSCVVLLSLDGAAPVLSPIVTTGTHGDHFMHNGLVYFKLQQTHTFCRVLQVQLECYSDPCGEIFICRSPTSERIMFGQSLAHGLDGLHEVQQKPNAASELFGMLPALRILVGQGGGLAGPPTRVQFDEEAWNGTEPNLRIIVPADQHMKGIYAHVVSAAARNDNVAAAALLCWERHINGDIVLKSDTRIPGEIFIERG